MRVATFNVQHGRRTRGPVDVPALVRACAALDADVLGLQEVDVGGARVGGADLAAAVAEGTGSTVAFGEALRLPGGGRYGNALLVRGALDAVEVRPLPQPPPARRPRRRRAAEEGRVAVIARARLAEGGEVAVAVCHLGLRGEESRAQLDEVIAALGRRPAPLVLLGDLNLGRRVVRAPLRRAGFTIAGGPASFPSWRPLRRIDHVAVAGLAVGAVRVPATGSSDHRPVVVDLEPLGAGSSP